MHRDRWTWLMAASAMAAIVAVWGPWQLGVPGEWTWATIAPSAVTLVVAILLAVGGVGVIQLVDRTASIYANGSRGRRIMMALAMVSVCFAWLSAVREPIDWLKLAAGRSRDPWILYAPGASGYFTKSQTIESRSAFLSTYRDFVDEGEYLHQGTHPPGLALAYWRLANTVRAVPMLQSIADRSMSSGVRESFDVIAETQARSLSRVDRAVLWWAGVVTQFTVAFSIVPLLALLGRFADQRSAWRFAGLWFFVPAAAVFLPKSDCIYALLALTVAATWVKAFDGSMWTAAIAGFVASYALLLSLALGPMLLAIAVGSIYWASRDATRWKPLGIATGIAVLAGVAQLVPVALGGLDIVSVWLGNLKNHAAFYDHNPRTYLLWLPVNLVEGVVAAGVPIVVAATAQLTTARPTPNPNADTEVKPTRELAAIVTIAIIASWALLAISGKNMGEAARLWVLYTPWPIVAVAIKCERDFVGWKPLAYAGLIAFIAVVTRVDGFDLSGRAIGL